MYIKFNIWMLMGCFALVADVQAMNRMPNPSNHRRTSTLSAPARRDAAFARALAAASVAAGAAAATAALQAEADLSAPAPVARQLDFGEEGSSESEQCGTTAVRRVAGASGPIPAPSAVASLSQGAAELRLIRARCIPGEWQDEIPQDVTFEKIG